MCLQRIANESTWGKSKRKPSEYVNIVKWTERTAEKVYIDYKIGI